MKLDKELDGKVAPLSLRSRTWMQFCLQVFFQRQFHEKPTQQHLQDGLHCPLCEHEGCSPAFSGMPASWQASG